MLKTKNLLVLINIGSPTELSVPTVRKYLRNFFAAGFPEFRRGRP